MSNGYRTTAQDAVRVYRVGSCQSSVTVFSRLVHSWFNEKTQRLSGMFQRGATNPMTVVFHIDTTICLCGNIYKNLVGQKGYYCDKLCRVFGVFPVVSTPQGLSRSLGGEEKGFTELVKEFFRNIR